jgi:hypothetical protein
VKAGTEAATDLPREDDPKIAIGGVVAAEKPKPLPIAVSSHPRGEAEADSAEAAHVAMAPVSHAELDHSRQVAGTGQQGAAPPYTAAAHEIGHTDRRVGGGYSDLPERDDTHDYSDLPEALPATTGASAAQHIDPVLAQIEEDERQLEERQRRLYEMERLDNERRELQRRKEQRLRELGQGQQ